MEATNQSDIERVSKETLDTFEKISSVASTRLGDPYSTGPAALASINTFTSQAAVSRLTGIDSARRQSLESLAREPAIARITTRSSDDKVTTYYICRNTPHADLAASDKLAGRNSPIGRLASLSVGEEFDISTPGGGVEGKILEKALLHPLHHDGGWDSRNSILSGEAYGPLTLVSMRDALVPIPEIEIGDAFLAEILAEEERAANIIDGIRRNVITKMGLRDQPILDRYQDEIFRLPLDSQLLIVGPPGAGKTTTLIRRIGQKLDYEHLDEHERGLVQGDQAKEGWPHADSWMMFTPTELLKVYLKEAFAREGIAAPDQKISTWARFRLDLARNHFRILRTPNGGGPFVLKDGGSFIRGEVLHQQIAWYEDFLAWQNDEYWTDLRAAVELLGNAQSRDARRLSRSVAGIVTGGEIRALAETLAELVELAANVDTLHQKLAQETTTVIERSLRLQINKDRKFLQEFATFLDGLESAEEEGDDAESDDDDDVPAQESRTKIAAAMTAYMRNLRNQARGRFNRRAPSRGTRAGRIAEWIGDRRLSDIDLDVVGESLQTQAALRRFTHPVRRYFGGIASRYRRYRRTRQSEDRWYVSDATGGDVSPLEVDLMLLCATSAASSLIRNRGIRSNIDEPSYSVLKEFVGLLRNQVMVDEATDFSPIQLACMGALSNPDIQSFFACGDFHQRTTSWGSRSVEDFRWVSPQIDVRPIQISYRHTRQLNQLAADIVRLCGGDALQVSLPEHVNNEGVPPVLGVGLDQRDKVIAWLAHRIVEIEKLTKPLPSVAVLVNDEAEVGSIADGLTAALIDQNLNVVACYKGQFAGQESDIRVVDVQHIKGLEFEAVFFIGVDQLAELQPELFDKYLYVGATRAATYLGLTCGGDALPREIDSIAATFAANWQQ